MMTPQIGWRQDYLHRIFEHFFEGVVPDFAEYLRLARLSFRA